jgi:hypothetical protein
MRRTTRGVVGVGIAGYVKTALSVGGSYAGAGPTIRTDGTCVAPGDEAGITGSGFVAGGGRVRLSIAGNQAHADVDQQGGFDWALRVPSVHDPAPTVHRFSVRASQASSGLEASTIQHVAEVGARAFPKRGMPMTVASWHAVGLPRGRLYGHWLHDGSYVATRLLGTGVGPCNDLRWRASLLPRGHRASGKWTVKIDRHRRYRPSSGPQARAQLTIID